MGDHADEPGDHGSSHDWHVRCPERFDHHVSIGDPDDRGGVRQRVGQRSGELLEGLGVREGFGDVGRRHAAEQPGHHGREPHDAASDEQRADDHRAHRSAEHDDAAD